MTAEGFVMAMQGELLLRVPAPATRSRRLAPAWFLVSRSGMDGRLLLIGWAGRKIEAEAIEPPALVPRISLMGLLPSSARQGGRLRFTLLQAAPHGISIAGRLQPAVGFACLSGVSQSFALRVVARLPGGLRCRIAVARTPWIGEVVDSGSPARPTAAIR
jgi:hypothetical protein